MFFIFLLPILFTKTSKFFDNHCVWKSRALHNLIKRHLNMLVILCVAGLVDRVVTQYLGHFGRELCCKKDVHTQTYDTQTRKEESAMMTLNFALFPLTFVVIEDCIVLDQCFIYG